MCGHLELSELACQVVTGTINCFDLMSITLAICSNVMFLLFAAIIVIAVLVLRRCRRSYSVKGRYVKLTHFTADIMLCFIVQK